LFRLGFIRTISPLSIAISVPDPIAIPELQRELRGISPKTLSKTLRELEKYGLVSREVLNTKPPRVRYYLSESGWELRSLLIPLLKWVSKHGSKKAP